MSSSGLKCARQGLACIAGIHLQPLYAGSVHAIGCCMPGSSSCPVWSGSISTTVPKLPFVQSSSSGGGGAAAADTSRGWGSGSSSGEDEDSVDGLGWVVEGAVLEARRDHVLVALDRKVCLSTVFDGGSGTGLESLFMSIAALNGKAPRPTLHLSFRTCQACTFALFQSSSDLTCDIGLSRCENYAWHERRPVIDLMPNWPCQELHACCGGWTRCVGGWSACKQKKMQESRDVALEHAALEHGVGCCVKEVGPCV
eukprot:1161092-Pelagomonas_calceolata.AAC.12